jgi:hypothetical protein
MAQEPSDHSPAPWWRAPRLPAICAVALIHVVLVGIILWSQEGAIPLPPVRHEVFFLFQPPPKTVARLPRKIESTAITVRPRPLFQPPVSTPITVPPPSSNPLEMALFRCAPDNLANLTPEERHRCGEAYTELAFVRPRAVREQDPDVERWQTELLARNIPATAPCSSVERFEVNQFSHQTANAVMIDPACVLQQLTDQSSP